MFRKFLGRLRVILCYWKTFSVPKFLHGFHMLARSKNPGCSGRFAFVLPQDQGMEDQRNYQISSHRSSLRTHRAIRAGPTPPARTLSEHLPPDLIWTRFGPEKGDFRSESGQNRVQIRSGGRCSERVRARGVGPAGMALWVPKKS